MFFYLKQIFVWKLIELFFVHVHKKAELVAPCNSPVCENSHLFHKWHRQIGLDESSTQNLPKMPTADAMPTVRCLCLERKIADEIHAVSQCKATRSHVNIIPGEFGKKLRGEFNEIGNMEHLFRNFSNILPRPHLKRSQDQIQHEDEVENQLDWIAHPGNWRF